MGMEQGYCERARELRHMLHDTQRIIRDLRSALAEIDKESAPKEAPSVIYSEGVILWLVE